MTPHPARLSSLMRPASALGQCERGSMLIEFALVFPILVVMFLGLVEFGEAFAVNRKLTNAANTVSDLVAQVATITASDLNDIARVAEEIVKPYAATPMRTVVSSVATDQDGNVKVVWSYAHGNGAAARETGKAFNLPSGLIEPNSSIIVAETFYQFSPSVGMFLTGPIQLSGEAFFRPRLSSAVIFDN
jgi:Flp pilus assembly protein TadG